MLRFLSQNPVTQAMDQQESKQRERMRDERIAAQDERADRDYAFQQQERSDRKASEEATRAYQASQIGEENTGLRQLAQTPGTSAVVGQELERQRQQKAAQQEEQDKAERLAVQALASGDDVTYNYWKQKAPELQIPPEVERNSQNKQLFGKGMLVAEKIYRDDQAQAHQFVTEFMRNGGNLEQSLAATGAPRSKPDLKPIQVVRDGRNVLAMVDAYGNISLSRDQSGTPYEAPQKSAGGGKFYVVQTGRGSMLVDKGTGQARMLGLGPDGSPMQIGPTFIPQWDENNQPVLPNIDSSQMGRGQPSYSPGNPLGDQQGNVGQAGTVAQPLLSPSIDPEAQANKTTAVESAKRDVKRQDTFQKARGSMSAVTQQNQIVLQNIDKAMRDISGWSTGLAGQALSNIGGTDAHNLKATLDTIQANLGFDKLQDMRNNSPTGGALGSVTERELALLQSTFGSVEQSQTAEQLEANLARLKEVITNSVALRQRAFEQDFGDFLGNQTQAQAPQNNQPTPGMIEDGHRFLGGDPSDPGNWEEAE